MHRHVCLFGVMALLFLAVWLWNDDDADITREMLCLCDEARAHIAERDALPTEPAKIPGRVATFDHGRTTIPPKVSDETLKRIRGT